jgi:hypothetical protein
MVRWKLTRVSEEDIASIFSGSNKPSKTPAWNQVASVVITQISANYSPSRTSLRVRNTLSRGYFTGEKYCILNSDSSMAILPSTVCREQIPVTFYRLNNDLNHSGDYASPQQVLLAPCFTLVSCLVYFSILKMEVMCSSEKSPEFQQTTRPYIPYDRTHIHHCETFTTYSFTLGRLTEGNGA